MCRLRTEGWKFVPDEFVEPRRLNLKPDNPKQKKTPVGPFCDLARPDGFEPPTTWFEVTWSSTLFNPIFPYLL